MMFYVARGKCAGFTLIEIMIVIAIIAILAGIVVPNFMQARAEAQLAACAENCKAIFTAIQMASTRMSDYGIFKAAGVTNISNNTNSLSHGSRLRPWLIDTGYLEKFPTCPVASRQTSLARYIILYGIGNGILVEDIDNQALKCLGWYVECPEEHFVGDFVIYPAYSQNCDILYVVDRN